MISYRISENMMKGINIVRKKSLIENWISYHETHQKIVAPIILIMLSIAFALSDWMYGYFTFSEYILFIVVTFLAMTFQFRFKKFQLKWLLLSFGMICFHLVLQYFLNENFVLKVGITGAIKLLFYLFITVGIYNYIRRNQLEITMIKWNLFISLIVILLGIFITFELYRETRIPQEIFWKFTRRDIYSYYFESNPAIIRTRSIFSEPAHLGFYLNTLFAATLFYFKGEKINPFFSLVLALGVLLTFSYSMIGIMIIISFLKIGNLFLNKKLKWNHWMWIIPLILIGISIPLWNIINTTLIQRSIAILTGEDTSARMRLLDSWQYTNRENILIGNGIGHTPIVTNIYSYMLSDLGVIGLGVSLFISGYIISLSPSLGIIFILLNISKGGYLASGYWFMVLFILMCASIHKQYREKNLGKISVNH